MAKCKPISYSISTKGTTVSVKVPKNYPSKTSKKG